MTEDVGPEVLRRFVDGDRDAFAELYNRFHRDVHAWTLRILRDPAAADDAVVEAFWRAYRGRARFDPSRPFGAWMRRIATNAALDQLRALASWPSQDVTDTIAAAPGPDADLQRQITRALHALPAKMRVVAVLALVEEQPLAEIADALNVPIGTVKSRLFRATRALRAALMRVGIQP